MRRISWRVYVLSPNKFLTRPRAYYKQGFAGSVAYRRVMRTIKLEDRVFS